MLVGAHRDGRLRDDLLGVLCITTGKVHDVNLLDAVPLPPGTIVVIDRGYLDVATLYARHQQQVGSSSAPRDNLRYTWIASR